MGLFDRIREAAAEVADRAQWVTLKAERLDAFANELVPGPAAKTDAGGISDQDADQADPAHRSREDPESSLAFARIAAAAAAPGTDLTVEILGEDYPARVLDGPLYDPEGARLRL